MMGRAATINHLSTHLWSSGSARSLNPLLVCASALLTGPRTTSAPASLSLCLCLHRVAPRTFSIWWRVGALARRTWLLVLLSGLNRGKMVKEEMVRCEKKHDEGTLFTISFTHIWANTRRSHSKWLLLKRCPLRLLLLLLLLRVDAIHPVR